MAFITQTGKQHEMRDKIAEETRALEALVSGVNQISQSTLLLKKKKEMHEVDDALDFMKEEYKTRIKACEQRQRKFERRQGEMKEQVTKFEKFIQENDSKRQRADIKTKGERHVLNQKQSEQLRQTQELEALELERKSQIEQLEKLRKYKVYLERTVETAEDETAEEIWDLLNRHKTLKNANQVLMAQVQKGDEDMDTLRDDMERLKLQRQSETLVTNSRIHEKQKDLEALRARTKKQDDSKLAQEDRVKDATRETAQIMSAVRNLYHRSLTTMHARVVPINFNNDASGPGSSNEQLNQLSQCLDLIRERLVDLSDICETHENEHTNLPSSSMAR